MKTKVFEKARDGSRKFVLNFINGYKSGLYSSLTVNLIDVFKKGVGKALVQADKAVEEGKRLEEKYKLKEQLASLASKTQDNLDKAKQIVSQKLSGGSVSDEDVDEFLKSEALASLHKYKDYLKEVNELYRAMYDDIKREKRENSKWKRLCESLRRECVPTNAEISQENAMLDFHASLSNEIVGNYLTPSNGLSVTEDKIVFQILSAIISEGGFPSGSVPDVSLLQLVFNEKVREEVRRTQVPGCVEVIKQAALGVIVGKPFLDSEPMLDNPFNAVEEKLKEMAASVVSNVTTQGTQLASDVQANIQSKLDDSRDKMKTATETLASNSTLQSKLSTAKTHISSMSTQIESMAKDLKEQAQKNPPTATE